MSTTDDILMQTARHEAGHALACWFCNGQIIGATLGSDSALAGAVWSQYNTSTLAGQRQELVGIAAGCAAEGVPTSGDDKAKLHAGARRIVGMTGTAEESRAEIEKAEYAARWLVGEYRAEVETIAQRLVEFHKLLDGMERRHNPDGIA